MGALVMAGLGILARPAGLLGRLTVRHAIIDLAHGGYRVAPALAKGPDRTEEFSSMIGRLKPYAAICGTYYDPDNKPLGDIVVDGRVVCRGGQRQAIGFTSTGKIKFLERKVGSRINWHGCFAGIACGPRLLRAGKIDINVKRDGFNACAATNLARRSAVGATRDGKLVMCVVTDEITLRTMAQLMLELGARDAINLDGGSMCALYENGRYLVEPLRPMSSILAVHKRR